MFLDGASCHGTPQAIEILESIFGNNIIRLKNSRLPHPAHSPDWSLCDGAIWPFVRRYIHPNPDINPLNLSIKRCHEWYDQTNPNGITSCWPIFENWVLGFGYIFIIGPYYKNHCNHKWSTPIFGSIFIFP